MARYKDYYKGDRIASIRMFGLKDSNNLLNFRYIGIFNVDSEEETKIPFEDRFEAEAYMKKLGYKEY